MKSARDRAPGFAVALCAMGAAACGGSPGGESGDVEIAEVAATAEAPTGIRLEAVRAPGLDRVQVAGGPSVDHIVESIGAGAAWLDYDGDGATDLYLAMGSTPASPSEGPPDVLLRNVGDTDGDGVPEFRDVTAAAGLGDRRWTFGVSVADVEGDGDPDLYLANWGANRLYLNRGDGTFADVAPQAGAADASWSVDSAWSDVDRDGDLDLYVVNYVDFAFDRYPARGERLAGGGPPCVWKGLEVFCGPRNLAAAGDRLLRNDGDPDGDGIPRFTDVTREAGVELPEPLFGLTAHFFDGDDDGDDDLYVANDSVRNTWFVNRGDGTFDERSILSGLAYDEQGIEQAGMGIAVADYDGDGRLDVAVTNFSHDHDTLYRNDGGGFFSDVSFTTGISGPSFLALGWGLAWVDFDQDGWEDLYVARGHVYPQVDDATIGTSFAQRDGVLRNRGDGTLLELGTAAGPGLEAAERSFAVLPHDFDGDGDFDLLVTHWNGAPTLLRNTGAHGRWSQVRLRSRGGNRDAIGARVTLRAGARTHVREIRRDAPYGAVLPVAHFGLGGADGVEWIEVRWPSGARSRVEEPTMDRLVELEEPQR